MIRILLLFALITSVISFWFTRIPADEAADRAASQMLYGYDIKYSPLQRTVFAEVSNTVAREFANATDGVTSRLHAALSELMLSGNKPFDIYGQTSPVAANADRMRLYNLSRRDSTQGFGAITRVVLATIGLGTHFTLHVALWTLLFCVIQLLRRQARILIQPAEPLVAKRAGFNAPLSTLPTEESAIGPAPPEGTGPNE